MDPLTVWAGNQYVLEEVCRYLSVRDICSLCCVSQAWRSALNFNYIWYRKVSALGWAEEIKFVQRDINQNIIDVNTNEEPYTESDDSLCDWAKVFYSCLKLRKIWRDGSAEVFYPDIPSTVKSHKIACFDIEDEILTIGTDKGLILIYLLNSDQEKKPWIVHPVRKNIKIEKLYVRHKKVALIQSGLLQVFKIYPNPELLFCKTLENPELRLLYGEGDISRPDRHHVPNLPISQLSGRYKCNDIMDLSKIDITVSTVGENQLLGVGIVQESTLSVYSFQNGDFKRKIDLEPDEELLKLGLVHISGHNNLLYLVVDDPLKNKSGVMFNVNDGTRLWKIYFHAVFSYDASVYSIFTKRGLLLFGRKLGSDYPFLWLWRCWSYQGEQVFEYEYETEYDMFLADWAEVGSQTLACHKTLLASSSPYFRALFRSNDKDSSTVDLSGMPEDVVETILDFFYSGKILVNAENVSDILSTADLLLLPWVMTKCSEFLSTTLNIESFIAVWRLSIMYRLENLERAVLNYCYTEFIRIADSDELAELTRNELLAILCSDQLDAQEDVLVDTIVKWSQLKGELLESDFCDEIRFPLCSQLCIENIDCQEKYMRIRESPSYQAFRNGDISMDNFSKQNRCRSTNRVLVTHCDGGNSLYGYHVDEQAWKQIADIPERAGCEYSVLAGFRSQIFLVGGRNRLSETLKTVSSFDLTSESWKQWPPMREARWCHGCIIVGNKMYAVAGCGQLDSMEMLDLTNSSDDWQPLPSLSFKRHMPGVGALEHLIFVCGGSDDSWNAQSEVEMFDTSSGEWVQLPSLQVPRVQPAVVSLEGRLYVAGGRNSNKVELMSVEMWDPTTHSWSMCKEMHRKRWGGGAATLHQLLVIVGGRGKRASNTAEVYSAKSNSWTLLPGTLPVADRRYSACAVQKPWTWEFN